MEIDPSRIADGSLVGISSRLSAGLRVSAAHRKPEQGARRASRQGAQLSSSLGNVCHCRPPIGPRFGKVSTGEVPHTGRHFVDAIMPCNRKVKVDKTANPPEVKIKENGNTKSPSCPSHVAIVVHVSPCVLDEVGMEVGVWPRSFWAARENNHGSRPVHPTLQGSSTPPPVGRRGTRVGATGSGSSK